jgi:hypothetical protein
MSDKPLPITLTGLYKGYQVSVQVEATLDNLDRLVERLQARGVEPLAAPAQAPAPASKGSGKQKERIAGKLTRTLTMKLNVYKFELAPDDGTERVTCAMFRHLTGWQDEAFQGQHMVLEGKWEHSEEWGSSFVVSKVIEAERRQSAA